jgi:hypothetical protein
MGSMLSTVSSILIPAILNICDILLAAYSIYALLAPTSVISLINTALGP